jgi:hypothetical protein
VQRREKDRSLLLQIPDLVSPLSQDSQRIFKERDDNHKTSNGRQMGLQWLRVNFNIVLHLLGESAQFLDWLVRVGSSVARGRARVSETVRVGVVVVRLRTCDTDSRRHGGGF